MISRSDCILSLKKSILGEAKVSHWLMKQLSLSSQMNPDNLERHINNTCNYLQSSTPTAIFNILSDNTTVDLLPGHNNNDLPDDVHSGNCSSSR